MGSTLNTAVMQQTLKSAISCTGIGLHSGEKVLMTLHPAAPDFGIVFRRTDLAGEGVEISASHDSVVDTRMCTTIGAKGKTIGTVEHLMAALAGAGVDNALIEVGGTEVPVMDGSAAPFLFLIDCAGVVEQDTPRKVLRVLKTVTVVDGDSSATLTPSDTFTLDFHIEFDNALIGRQSMTVDMTNGVFKDEISRARTFGFLHQAEALQAAGLAKGASLENAVVFNGDKIMNEDGMRFEDECVRHKILDAVGDLYMAGTVIQCHYEGVRASHALNNLLLRELFADCANYEFVDATEANVEVAASQGASSWSKDTVAASPAMI